MSLWLAIGCQQHLQCCQGADVLGLSVSPKEGHATEVTVIACAVVIVFSCCGYQAKASKFILLELKAYPVIPGSVLGQKADKTNMAASFLTTDTIASLVAWALESAMYVCVGELEPCRTEVETVIQRQQPAMAPWRSR